MHVSSKVRFVASVAAAVVAFGSIATTAASADGEALFRRLYREDANAEFVVRHGDCAAERTVVSTSFHHDFFEENGVARPRNVFFGASIQEFDCEEQLVAVYDTFGDGVTPRPFDVQPGLTSAWAEMDIEVCQTFPEPTADCVPFPVHVRLGFTGVGNIEVTVKRDQINDPDCVIRYFDRMAVRQAKAFGSIEFTPPSGPARSFDVTAADLSPNGATLSKEFERSYMRGDGFNCTER